MLLPKETLYDWFGGNTALFLNINAIRGETYDAAMLFLTRTADQHNFPFFFGALAIWSVIGFVYRKIRHKGGTNHYIAAWFATLMVIGIGFAAEIYVVGDLKEHFSFPRPYIALQHDNVRLLDHPKNEEDGHHSLPSGHAAFATLIVVGAWPVLSSGMSLVALSWLIGVCWSRMALGMHFPADLLAGFLISLLIITVVRHIIYAIIWKLFKIRC